MTAHTTTDVRLRTSDGAYIHGLLRVPRGRAGTVVSIMHPREDSAHHPFAARLLEEGVAVWTQGTRSPNNDVRLLHEEALLDVAAGQAYLEDSAFDARVTLGHSGGATLFAFYQQQAGLSAERRLAAAPDGTPVDLAKARMPPPHGSIFVAPHPGQGVLLQRVIDPSVVDEADPLSVDPSLDPYAPLNGFRPPPESSHYSSEFVDRYRTAQVARVQRIDDLAANAVAVARRAQELGASDVAQRRRSLVPTVIVVHRTDADLRSVDLTLEPNGRPYGSLFGSRPDLGNFNFPGFCRITTPSAWMSTWSATTSRANFVRNACGVTSPSLLVELTGDQACFPADAREMYAALAATDKTHVQVAGTHFGGPIAPDEPSGIELSARQIGRWLRERFLCSD